MSVVSTTAVVTLEPQNITDLKSSPYVHVKSKKNRRPRDNTAFHHVIFREPGTRIVFLIYTSGKCVILSSRNESEMASASLWIATILNSDIITPVAMKNIVYVYQFPFPETKMNQSLSRLHDRLKQCYDASFEPELSPALMLNPKSCPSAKAMIFRSGKINITGIKKESEILKIRGELDGILSGSSDKFIMRNLS